MQYLGFSKDTALLGRVIKSPPLHSPLLTETANPEKVLGPILLGLASMLADRLQRELDKIEFVR